MWTIQTFFLNISSQSIVKREIPQFLQTDDNYSKLSIPWKYNHILANLYFKKNYGICGKRMEQSLVCFKRC